MTNQWIGPGQVIEVPQGALKGRTLGQFMADGGSLPLQNQGLGYTYSDNKQSNSYNAASFR